MKQTAAIEKEKMKKLITGERLLQACGVFAIIAGILYILIQFIHPEESVTVVSTSFWLIVALLTTIMSLCSLLGVFGIYLNKIESIGLIGFIGMCLFNIFWFLSATFSFNEAFIYPLLTQDAPQFLEGMLSLFEEPVYTEQLGVFPLLTSLVGGFYILGSILFGISLYVSKAYPRWITILLTFAAVATIGAAFVPHPIDRLFALPMGIAFISLGYELFKENKNRENTRKRSFGTN